MELKIAFIGFGNVAREFARILIECRSQLVRDFNLRWKVTAIATANHGCIVSSEGIDLADVLARVAEGSRLVGSPGSTSVPDPPALIDICDADVLFETTPLDITSGEPGVSNIRAALGRGINVITANKGPVAFAYSELKALAARHRVNFRFEGTVMDGTPVFNLVEKCMPGARVVGFSGVLNSSTNLILTEMESGRSFEDALAYARRLGITEADASFDIDGWDAAAKAVALANVLMDASARPCEVERKGIRGITNETVLEAGRSGLAVRLVARGKRAANGVKLKVSPETVPVASVLGAVRGTSNVLILETDFMGDLAITETDPGIKQTAYALLSDLLAIHTDARGRAF